MWLTRTLACRGMQQPGMQQMVSQQLQQGRGPGLGLSGGGAGGSGGGFTGQGGFGSGLGLSRCSSPMPDVLLPLFECLA